MTTKVKAIMTEGLIAQGKHTIWVPATAMISRPTGGAGSGSVETATNKVVLKSLDFDTASVEYAQFSIQMPISWNEGTVSAKFVWKHAVTITNFGVVFGIQGVAISNDDPADVAFGTAQYISDTGGTPDDVYITDETPAITLAGTPVAGDWVVFQVVRDVTAGGDTLDIDAGLLGVSLFYTVDEATD